MVGLLTLISPFLRIRSSLPTCKGIRANVRCGLISLSTSMLPLQPVSGVCDFSRNSRLLQRIGASRVPGVVSTGDEDAHALAAWLCMAVRRREFAPGRSTRQFVSVFATWERSAGHCSHGADAQHST